MRSHAKALTAESTKRQATGLGRFFHSALAAALAAFLFSAAPASAATVTSHPLLPFSPITGAGIGVTLHDPAGIGIDEANGNVFLNDGRVFGGTGGNITDIFDAEGGVPSGVAAPYQITGVIFGPNVTSVAVDNWATSPSKGAVYVVDTGHSTVKKFVRNAGTELYEEAGQLAPSSGPSLVSPIGAAVDSHGNVFVAEYLSQSVIEFSPTGTQLARIDTSASVGQPGAVAVDNAGDLFVQGVNDGSAYKYPANGSGQVEEGVFTQVLAPGSGAKWLAVDTATNTLYVAFADHVNQYDAATLALQGKFGESALAEAVSLGVNSATGTVYVSDLGQTNVVAFGPAITGTVPDPTIEATSEIGVSKAKFNGKINPQSVPNRYFFEWTEGAGSSWGGAKSSPPQSIAPSDSVEHPVSFNASGLGGNRTYQVRLVAENTAIGLRSVSSAETFETTTAAAAPAVTIAAPSALTTTGAEVTGTVNPQEDFTTTWRVLISTDPACASGFSELSTHQLESEAGSPVAVAETLTGLLPNQHYCVRIEATNSAGATTSETKEFTTAKAPPGQVFTGFVAPRTDTAARINAYVNPQGTETTYHFEYSTDGSTWIPLADHSAGSGRGQIVVADELIELEPNTTYHYRFFAENEAGEANPQGLEKTFTTRTTAEMQAPRRGIEMVNNPDKGNQNVFLNLAVDSLVSSDGEEAIWSITGGAPGAPNGTLSTFLAERTASGWQSRSLAPPAVQQVGNGSLSYEIRGASPDFSQFLFSAQRPKVFSLITPGTLVRLDRNQGQQILKAYESKSREADMTDSSSHVLVLNEPTKQLEDIGSGTPEVVSLMPDGTESSCGLDFETGASFIGGTGTGGRQGTGVEFRPGYHMIAVTDASRVYFGAKPNGECSGTPYGLYVRNRETEETTLIDPGSEGSGGDANVAFIRATSDGRAAYFATKSQLDPADTNANADVYRWDEESEESTCLTCVVADAAVEDVNHSYLPILISDDFSHIYFESVKQLVAGHGTPGKPNLYVLSGGTVRFVTETNGVNTLGETATISPDGDVLAFMAQGGRNLTADEVENSGLVELYRYDERDGSIECLSCLHNAITTQAVGNEEGGNGGLQMSSDGSTVAFLTREALVPRDVNRGVDVYEWRNGATRVVTDGVTEFKTGLLAGTKVRGMDSSGDNIFFSVADPGLTGFEEDGLANFYDARIGGGFVPPSPPGHCIEDSCQGPLQPAPTGAHPDSSTYSGPGNAPSKVQARRPCAHKRGKAKQRCVRKHKRHASTARVNRNAGRAK